jgi:uncharacterized protein (TIGR02594 family)
MHPSSLSAIEFLARAATEAPWLEIAIREQGTKEIRGLQRNNPRILEYISAFPGLRNVDYLVPAPKTHKLVPSGFTKGGVDETPWCACFVAWCLRRAGQPTTRGDASAASWANFGTPLAAPRLGAITVVHRRPTKSIAGTTASGNHVAFYLTGPSLAPTLFGGNQGDRVCAKRFHRWTVKGYRWPWNFQSPLPSDVA